MDWATIVDNLLQNGSSLTGDELASALFACGRHSLEFKEEITTVSLLRQMESNRLMKAALLPGWKSLQSRWQQASEILQDVDDVIALQAERTLAEVMNDRDQWHVRGLGLRAAGLPELFHAVEMEVHRLDEFLKGYPEELDALAWMRQEALATAWDPASTAWSLVPGLSEEEAPSRHPSADALQPIGDEKLLLVAQELADPSLERRVAQALQRDDALRKHYESLVEDLALVQSAPQGVVLLPVRRLLREAPSARPLTQRAAASTQATPRYEIPDVDALVYTFEDGSELYAQAHDKRWVLFLSRENPGKNDGFDGPVLDELKQGDNILIAITHAGEVLLHYGDATMRLQLEELDR
jgi:hypothetical protein